MSWFPRGHSTLRTTVRLLVQNRCYNAPHTGGVVRPDQLTVFENCGIVSIYTFVITMNRLRWANP